LIVGALASDIGYVLIRKNGQNHPVINTVNISTLDTDVKKYIFNFNYFANSNGSGVEMFEVKINAYTGVNKDKVYSYGFQVLNPANMKTEFKKYKEVKFLMTKETYWTTTNDYSECEVTYFNSDDQFSYNATNALNENDTPYVIDVGGKTYAFKFDKITKPTYDYSGGLLSVNYIKASFDLFVTKMYAVSTVSDGEGIYDSLNVGLNDVFNLYEYNEITKKFDKLEEKFGYSAEYMGVYLTYHNRGATVHEDSIFNKIGQSKKGGVIYG